jgi:hypothetical protein
LKALAVLPLVLPLLLAAGCATPERVSPTPREIGFQALAEDVRIRHEPGGEDYARRVGASLAAAIRRVEALHGLPFRAAPVVHVCHDWPCFRRLVRTPDVAAAVVPDNLLVLSPSLHGRGAHRLDAILAHELSHLHLGQRLGHYTPSLPIWFHEGLATLAALGGGAEYASDIESCRAWNEGRQIDFDVRESHSRRLKGPDYGLSIHEFYRQAWRSVEALRAHDPRAFRSWLQALQASADFHIAFADAYNSDLDSLARVFFNAGPVCDDHGGAI